MQHSTPQANKADVARFERLREIGCLACRQWGHHSIPEVHHLLGAGKRRGHQYTVGLCIFHHRGATPLGSNKKLMETLLGPSLALNSKRFHEVFGNDEALLAMANKLLEENHGA